MPVGIQRPGSEGDDAAVPDSESQLGNQKRKVCDERAPRKAGCGGWRVRNTPYMMMGPQAAHTDYHKPAVFPGGMGATVYLFFASKGMPNPWAMAGRDQDIHEQGYHCSL
jgi:hypothetical protein